MKNTEVDWFEEVIPSLADPHLGPKERLALEEKLRTSRKLRLREDKKEQRRKQRKERRNQKEE